MRPSRSMAAAAADVPPRPKPRRRKDVQDPVANLATLPVSYVDAATRDQAREVVESYQSTIGREGVDEILDMLGLVATVRGRRVSV